MWHAWEKIGNCTGFWWESPKIQNHLEDRDVDERMESDWILWRLAGGCRVDPVSSG
jgi:hypothetical protein